MDAGILGYHMYREGQQFRAGDGIVSKGVERTIQNVGLLARVETVLRRYGKEARLLRFEDVEADTLSRTVRKAGIPVKLTVKEYELLLLFLRNPGIALFRDRIYQLVWGGEYSGDSRTVDLHVQRLRKKLQWEGKLFAVYKIGYRLEGGREREPR